MSSGGFGIDNDDGPSPADDPIQVLKPGLHAPLGPHDPHSPDIPILGMGSIAPGGIRAYHGTTAPEFDKFKLDQSNYMLDRGLGVHFAKDPKLSDSFIMERVNRKEIGPKPGGRMIRATIPSEEQMLTLDQPAYDWAGNVPNRKPWQAIATDQHQFEKLIMKEAYRRDPEMLARYLMQARGFKSEDHARKTAAALLRGDTVDVRENEPMNFDRFIENFGGKPFNDADRIQAVELARKALMERGHKGVKYLNTSPMETEGVDDATSYVVLDPDDAKFRRGGTVQGFEDGGAPEVDSPSPSDDPIQVLRPGIHAPLGPSGDHGIGVPILGMGSVAPVPAPIRAYHGSPHDFDKFSFDHIGKGQGAATYGHGLYFAEHPDVARTYRNTLAGAGYFTVNGRKSGVTDDAQADLGLMTPDQQRYVGRYVLDRMSEGVPLDRALAKAREDYSHFDPADLDAVEAKLLAGNPTYTAPGRSYEVAIKAHHDEFLDWDKPLSEQSERVRDAIADLYAAHGIKGGNVTGARAYGDLARAKGGQRMLGSADKQWGPVEYSDEPGASALLRDAGIKGVRYQDQESRTYASSLERERRQLIALEAAVKKIPNDSTIQHNLEFTKKRIRLFEEAQKKLTHNYVLFDDKHVDITNKYARGGMPDDRVTAALNIARKRGGSVSDAGFVRLAQKLLAQKGFYTGKVDGAAGKRTHAAIVAFQKDAGLDATGTMTEATLNALKAPPLPRMRPLPGGLSPTLTAGNKIGASASMEARVNPLAEEEPYRPPIGMGSDPGKFGPDLRDMGKPDTRGMPTTDEARFLAGGPQPKQVVDPAYGLGRRAKAEMDASEMRQRMPVKPITGQGEPFLPYVRKKLSDWNIIEPAQAGYKKGGSTFGPGSLPGASRAKRSSGVPGDASANPSMPYSPKGHTGGLLSPVGGRTDHIPLDVPNGAYVVPADVVSGLGQGNTLHGTKLLNHLFKGSFRRPHPLALKRASALRASGGAASGDADTIPIMAAGGEFVVPPEAVLEIGGGDMRAGHNALDIFVKKARAKTIDDMKKLPGPVKS